MAAFCCIFQDLLWNFDRHIFASIPLVPATYRSRLLFPLIRDKDGGVDRIN